MRAQRRGRVAVLFLTPEGLVLGDQQGSQELRVGVEVLSHSCAVVEAERFL